MNEQANNPLLDGKPPKDPSLMRSVLKNVHAANLAPAAGEHAQGLDRHAQLHLVSFHDAQVVRQFQRALSAEGIPSTVRSAGELQYVHVEMEDRDRARRIHSEFVKTHADRSDRRRNKRFDLAILGLVVGLTIGLVLALGAFHSVLDLLRVGLVGVIGALGGHLADRFRLGRSKGVLGFGVYEFLIIAIIPALIVVLQQITPELVFR